MTVKVHAGDLLIAPPQMPDPRFERSVMLVTHHNTRGAFALCVNRPSEHSLRDILEPIDIKVDQDWPLYWGGPVGLNTVWMIHDPEWSVDNTMRIDQHWAITSHINMFTKMSQGDMPSRFRIMFGHASWDAGQLAAELEGKEPWTHRSSWLVAQRPDPEWLLDSDVDNLWSSSCSLCSQQTVDSWMT